MSRSFGPHPFVTVDIHSAHKSQRMTVSGCPMQHSGFRSDVLYDLGIRRFLKYDDIWVALAYHRCDQRSTTFAAETNIVTEQFQSSGSATFPQIVRYGCPSRCSRT